MLTPPLTFDWNSRLCMPNGETPWPIDTAMRVPVRGEVLDFLPITCASVARTHHRYTSANCDPMTIVSRHKRSRLSAFARGVGNVAAVRREVRALCLAWGSLMIRVALLASTIPVPATCSTGELAAIVKDLLSAEPAPVMLFDHPNHLRSTSILARAARRRRHRHRNSSDTFESSHFNCSGTPAALRPVTNSPQLSTGPNVKRDKPPRTRSIIQTSRNARGRINE